MAVTRQHDKTEIIEIEEKICEKLIAVGKSLNLPLSFMFILVSGVWHRFYLETGVLFWVEGVTPDVEEDLCAGDKYLNLLCDSRIENAMLKSVKMENGVLTISFIEGNTIHFFEQDENTYLSYAFDDDKPD
jgi:hypothetical protein